MNVLKAQTFFPFSALTLALYLFPMATRKKNKARRGKKTHSSLEALLRAQGDASFRTSPLQAGGICPQCKQGRLAYNGMLALECPVCGFVSTEGAGCT